MTYLDQLACVAYPLDIVVDIAVASVLDLVFEFALDDFGPQAIVGRDLVLGFQVLLRWRPQTIPVDCSQLLGYYSLLW